MKPYQALSSDRYDRLQKVLSKHFGFEDFYSYQQQVIDAILSGKDSLTVISTGGGKSLCYQLPVLDMDGMAVVISPLISLIQDQVADLKMR